MQSDYLFVYGSLRPALGHYMQRYLRAFAEHRGAASVRGEIHDLGSYPGFVPGSRLVLGDLYLIKEAERLLPALDLYEGDEYTREIIVVGSAGSGCADSKDHSSEAWIYIYQGSLQEARLIESGDYADYRRRASGDGEPA